MKTRVIVVIGLFTGLAGVGLGLSARTPVEYDTARERTEEICGALARDAWALGQRRTYDVTTALNFFEGEALGKPQSTIHGRFTMHVAAQQKLAEGKLVEIHIHAERLTQRTAQGEESLAERYNTMLTAPTVALLDHTGAITRIQLPATLDSWGEGLSRSLIAELQLVIPRTTRDSTTTWTVNEIDGHAPHVATYTRTGPLSLQKVRRHYGRAAKQVLAQVRRADGEIATRPHA